AEMQKRVRVKQVMILKSKLKVIGPNSNSYQAFRLMLEQNLDLLPIISKSRIVGVVSKKKLTHCLIWELKYGLNKKISRK
ncbi:MAG: CBS domain-containing protein, partial [Candidatus Woesearchaeota archaeon]